jgi:hypothetical protein
MPLATPTRRMPTPEAVRDFFGDLLGKGVSVDKRAEIDLDDGDHVWVSGVFVEDDGSIGGACVADLTLASYAGAALAMVPKPVAEESIAQGELAEGLTENFHEIANILTALLNGASVPHLKIQALQPGVPEDVRDLVVRAAGRRTYDLRISDYGSGVLALYAR